jgi:hypothetical protein
VEHQEHVVAAEVHALWVTESVGSVEAQNNVMRVIVRTFSDPAFACARNARLRAFARVFVDIC